MPGMDGDEATRLIRESGASKSAFIVRWTTEFVRFGSIRVSTIAAPAPKPMSVAALADLLSEAIRRAANRADPPRTEAATGDHSPKP